MYKTKTHVIDFDQSRARILYSERRSYTKVEYLDKELSSIKNSTQELIFRFQEVFGMESRKILEKFSVR